LLNSDVLISRECPIRLFVGALDSAHRSANLPSSVRPENNASRRELPSNRTASVHCSRQSSSFQDLPGFVQNEVTHLKGDDSHICLLGGCLLITYVPLSSRLSVKTPLWDGVFTRTHACNRDYNTLTWYSTSKLGFPSPSSRVSRDSSRASMVASDSSWYLPKESSLWYHGLSLGSANKERR
jgi:hypothetical protein